MIRKPPVEARREHALVAASRAVVTHGPAVARVGPLLMRGAALGCLALYMGYVALRGGMASIGLPAIVVPAASGLALASASARAFARALGETRGRDVDAGRPEGIATEGWAAEAHKPQARPFGRRTG